MKYTTRTEVKIDFSENELKALYDARAILEEMDSMVVDTKVGKLTFNEADYTPADIYTAFILLNDIIEDYC